MNFSPNRPEKPDDPLIRAIRDTSDLHVNIQKDLQRSLKVNTMLTGINMVCLLIVGAWVIGATIAHFFIQH